MSPSLKTDGSIENPRVNLVHGHATVLTTPGGHSRFRAEADSYQSEVGHHAAAQDRQLG
jgi:hypothetical protein